ncbi:MAG: YggT family protein [Candidatus Saccharibacteria bacterium]|nr:YggT family protein [Candidatus Saccharibacteria bacterium]
MRLSVLATNLVNFFVGAVQAILGVRFLLRLFGANEANGFVDWVYEMSAVLLQPFRGVFPTQVFDNQYVLEFSTLFAMLVYALVGMFVLWLIVVLTPEEPVTKKKRR